MPQCANCEGSHAAYTAECPARLAAIRRAKIFVSGRNPAPVGGNGSSVNELRKSAPRMTNVEYPTLTPLRTNGGHTYATVAFFQNSPVQPSITRLQQLYVTQRLALQTGKGMEILKKTHEAQMQALAHEERCSSLPNGARNLSAVLGDIRQKMSIINESLMVLFASLQSLVTVVPPGEARTTLQSLADMGTPLLAITSAFQANNDD